MVKRRQLEISVMEERQAQHSSGVMDHGLKISPPGPPFQHHLLLLSSGPHLILSHIKLTAIP